MYDGRLDFNCTMSFISDEYFHLLEFYVHNDAPLTCRIPARPLTAGETDAKGDKKPKDDSTSASSGQENTYIPLSTPSLSHPTHQSRLPTNAPSQLKSLPYPAPSSSRTYTSPTT